MQPERRHYAVLFGASMGLLMVELSFARTLAVSARRIAVPEQMRFAGER